MTLPNSAPEPQDRLPGEAPHGTPARFQMPVIGDGSTQAGAVASRGAVPTGHPSQVSATPVPTAGTSREPTVAAVFGSLTRDGHWTVAQRMKSVTVFGETTLDLRQASFEAAEVHISVYAAFGEVKVIVPPGVAVETPGVVVFGERKTQLRSAPMPGAPRVVVSVSGAFAEVTVRELDYGQRWSKWRNPLAGG